MDYSVKELREELDKKISTLGIDSKFKNNPAYVSALAQIESLISQMNMFQASESVMVKDDGSDISFNWVSETGVKYSMLISSFDSNAIRCIRTQEEEPFFGMNGQTVRQKNVIEEVATFDEKNETVTIMTNSSSVDNIDCKVGTCNNTTWSEKKVYNSDGVMCEREYKGFKTGELTEAFDRTEINSMLYIPRQAFTSGMWFNGYEKRSLLVRDKLDTARVLIEDKSRGVRYMSRALLNQEHGLRDMSLLGGYNSFPQDVVIPPLSKETIDMMIQSESNPKVAEGLKKYSTGRDTYFYDSTQDKYFVSAGVENPKESSK